MSRLVYWSCVVVLVVLVCVIDVRGFIKYQHFILCDTFIHILFTWIFLRLNYYCIPAQLRYMEWYLSNNPATSRIAAYPFTITGEHRESNTNCILYYICECV